MLLPNFSTALLKESEWAQDSLIHLRIVWFILLNTPWGKKRPPGRWKTFTNEIHSLLLQILSSIVAKPLLLYPSKRWFSRWLIISKPQRLGCQNLFYCVFLSASATICEVISVLSVFFSMIPISEFFEAFLDLRLLELYVLLNDLLKTDIERLLTFGSKLVMSINAIDRYLLAFYNHLLSRLKLFCGPSSTLICVCSENRHSNEVFPNFDVHEYWRRNLLKLK